MKAKIFCVATNKGIQSFYVRLGGKEYFLFDQGYRKSNKVYFCNGVTVDDIGNFSTAHSTAVRNTLEKLPFYIREVERRFGIAIYDRTKERESKRQRAFKRQAFRWQNNNWDIA